MKNHKTQAFHLNQKQNLNLHAKHPQFLKYIKNKFETHQQA